METTAQSLLFVLVFALIGGVLARLVKFPTLIGYVLAGIVGGFILGAPESIEGLAHIGVILLLFSVGLEVSFSRLYKVGGVAVLGAVVQMFLVTALAYGALSIVGIDSASAFIMAAAFSLSSTSFVIKILGERGEEHTIHGDIMTAWLLVQDLAVVPLMAFLPLLAASEEDVLSLGVRSVWYSGLVLVVVFFFGRLVAPYVIHKVSSMGSRELLSLSGISLALGTGFVVSLFGVTPSLGAFLAGLVISESQENHAIFAETRPLRDLFVITFFVTLGFLVPFPVVLANLGLILGLAAFVLVLKFAVIFGVLSVFSYRGKTLLFSSIGMSQVGEFAFVLFLGAKGMGLMNSELSSVGIATALLTLITTPLSFKIVVPLWRRFKHFRLISGVERKLSVSESFGPGHIVICGYGRVGRWVGNALLDAKQAFVVVDYNQKVLKTAELAGIPVIYGDPAEPEVLEAAGVRGAKGLILSLPDRIAQEEIISYTQTVNPNAKIIARAHLDEDFEKLYSLKVRKVISPEFEAAVAIVKDIFITMGKSKEEIASRVKVLRVKKGQRK